MSRRFSIGFVAALALLVSAGPALGAARPHNQPFDDGAGGASANAVGPHVSQKGWATFPSSVRGSYAAPTARGFLHHCNVDR
jgi:hypothetical protein